MSLVVRNHNAFRHSLGDWILEIFFTRLRNLVPIIAGMRRGSRRPTAWNVDESDPGEMGLRG